jgi:hypothetical protein
MTTPQPTPSGSSRTLSVVSGETGLPVRSGIVTVGDRPYPIDPNGTITVSGPVTGTSIDVDAPTFLLRQTSLGASSELLLWPRQSDTGLDEVFTRAVVYGSGAGTGDRLIRWAPDVTRVAVVPSPEIQSDPIAMETHRRACAILTDANGVVTFSVDSSPVAGRMIATAVDPTDPLAQTGAGIHRSYSGYFITGGTIVFRRATGPRSLGVLLHELGHGFGLSHSLNGARDIMGPGPDDHVDFSAAEKLAMRLMLTRRGGNQFPDNDRGLVPASAASGSGVRCPLENAGI